MKTFVSSTILKKPPSARTRATACTASTKFGASVGSPSPLNATCRNWSSSAGKD